MRTPVPDSLSDKQVLMCPDIVSVWVKLQQNLLLLYNGFCIYPF